MKPPSTGALNRIPPFGSTGGLNRIVEEPRFDVRCSFVFTILIAAAKKNLIIITTRFRHSAGLRRVGLDRDEPVRSHRRGPQRGGGWSVRPVRTSYSYRTELGTGLRAVVRSVCRTRPYGAVQSRVRSRIRGRAGSYGGMYGAMYGAVWGRMESSYFIRRPLSFFMSLLVTPILNNGRCNNLRGGEGAEKGAGENREKS